MSINAITYNGLIALNTEDSAKEAKTEQEKSKGVRKRTLDHFVPEQENERTLFPQVTGARDIDVPHLSPQFISKARQALEFDRDPGFGIDIDAKIDSVIHTRRLGDDNALFLNKASVKPDQPLRFETIDHNVIIAEEDTPLHSKMAIRDSKLDILEMHVDPRGRPYTNEKRKALRIHTLKVDEGDEVPMVLSDELAKATIPGVFIRDLTYEEVPRKNEKGEVVTDENGKPVTYLKPILDEEKKLTNIAVSMFTRGNGVYNQAKQLDKTINELIRVPIFKGLAKKFGVDQDKIIAEDKKVAPLESLQKIMPQISTQDQKAFEYSEGFGRVISNIALYGLDLGYVRMIGLADTGRFNVMNIDLNPIMNSQNPTQADAKLKKAGKVPLDVNSFIIPDDPEVMKRAKSFGVGWKPVDRNANTLNQLKELVTRIVKTMPKSSMTDLNVDVDKVMEDKGVTLVTRVKTAEGTSLDSNIGIASRQSFYRALRIENTSEAPNVQEVPYFRSLNSQLEIPIAAVKVDPKEDEKKTRFSFLAQDIKMGSKALYTTLSKHDAFKAPSAVMEGLHYNISNLHAETEIMLNDQPAKMRVHMAQGMTITGDELRIGDDYGKFIDYVADYDATGVAIPDHYNIEQDVISTGTEATIPHLSFEIVLNEGTAEQKTIRGELRNLKYNPTYTAVDLPGDGIETLANQIIDGALDENLLVEIFKGVKVASEGEVELAHLSYQDRDMHIDAQVGKSGIVSVLDGGRMVYGPHRNKAEGAPVSDILVNMAFADKEGETYTGTNTEYQARLVVLNAKGDAEVLTSEPDANGKKKFEGLRSRKGHMDTAFIFQERGKPDTKTVARLTMADFFGGLRYDRDAKRLYMDQSFGGKIQAGLQKGEYRVHFETDGRSIPKGETPFYLDFNSGEISINDLTVQGSAKFYVAKAVPTTNNPEGEVRIFELSVADSIASIDTSRTKDDLKVKTEAKDARVIVRSPEHGDNLRAELTQDKVKIELILKHFHTALIDAFKDNDPKKLAKLSGFFGIETESKDYFFKFTDKTGELPTDVRAKLMGKFDFEVDIKGHDDGVAFKVTKAEMPEAYVYGKHGKYKVEGNAQYTLKKLTSQGIKGLGDIIRYGKGEASVDYDTEGAIKLDVILSDDEGNLYPVPFEADVYSKLDRLAIQVLDNPKSAFIGITEGGDVVLPWSSPEKKAAVLDKGINLKVHGWRSGMRDVKANMIIPGVNGKTTKWIDLGVGQSSIEMPTATLDGNGIDALVDMKANDITLYFINAHETKDQKPDTDNPYQVLKVSIKETGARIHHSEHGEVKTLDVSGYTKDLDLNFLKDDGPWGLKRILANQKYLDFSTIDGRLLYHALKEAWDGSKFDFKKLKNVQFKTTAVGNEDPERYYNIIIENQTDLPSTIGALMKQNEGIVTLYPDHEPGEDPIVLRFENTSGPIELDVKIAGEHHHETLPGYEDFTVNLKENAEGEAYIHVPIDENKVATFYGIKPTTHAGNLDETLAQIVSQEHVGKVKELLLKRGYKAVPGSAAEQENNQALLATLLTKRRIKNLEELSQSEAAQLERISQPGLKQYFLEAATRVLLGEDFVTKHVSEDSKRSITWEGLLPEQEEKMSKFKDLTEKQQAIATKVAEALQERGYVFRGDREQNLEILRGFFGSDAKALFNYQLIESAGPKVYEISQDHNGMRDLYERVFGDRFAKAQHGKEGIEVWDQLTDAQKDALRKTMPSSIHDPRMTYHDFKFMMDLDVEGRRQIDLTQTPYLNAISRFVRGEAAVPYYQLDANAQKGARLLAKRFWAAGFRLDKSAAENVAAIKKVYPAMTDVKGRVDQALEAFDLNHHNNKYYVDLGRKSDPIPFLGAKPLSIERAQFDIRINPKALAENQDPKRHDSHPDISKATEGSTIDLKGIFYGGREAKHLPIDQSVSGTAGDEVFELTLRAGLDEFGKPDRIGFIEVRYGRLEENHGRRSGDLPYKINWDAAPTSFRVYDPFVPTDERIETPEKDGAVKRLLFGKSTVFGFGMEVKPDADLNIWTHGKIEDGAIKVFNLASALSFGMIEPLTSFDQDKGPWKDLPVFNEVARQLGISKMGIAGQFVDIFAAAGVRAPLATPHKDVNGRIVFTDPESEQRVELPVREGFVFNSEQHANEYFANKGKVSEQPGTMDEELWSRFLYRGKAYRWDFKAEGAGLKFIPDPGFTPIKKATK